MPPSKNNGRMNFIIRVLIYSDFLLLSATGFINPIFALFITQQVKGSTIEIVGYSATILLVVKSILQVPIARYVDKIEGEKDDLYFVIGGSILISLTSFVYIFATEIWHLYGLQAIYGVGAAMAYPAWFALFTRHADHHREGFEWGIYSSSVGFGVAAAAAVGGIIAERFGFGTVFILVGTLSLLGTGLLFFLRNHIIEQDNHLKLAAKKV